MGVAYKVTNYGETTISTQKYVDRLEYLGVPLNRFYSFLNDAKQTIESASQSDNYQLLIILEYEMFSGPDGEGCYDDWFLTIKLYNLTIPRPDWLIHHLVKGVKLIHEYEDKENFEIRDLSPIFDKMPSSDIPDLIVLNKEETLRFLNGEPVGVSCPLYILSS